MIQANELRIGNLLLFDSIVSEVTAIDLDLDGVSKDLVANGTYNFIEISSGRIKGIKIAEKILTDCGFEKVGNISPKIHKWATGHAKFILYFDGEQAGLITSLPKTVPIIYLHQLQNLYFSLIGEELKVRSVVND